MVLWASCKGVELSFHDYPSACSCSRLTLPVLKEYAVVAVSLLPDLRPPGRAQTPEGEYFCPADCICREGDERSQDQLDIGRTLLRPYKCMPLMLTLHTRWQDRIR